MTERNVVIEGDTTTSGGTVQAGRFPATYGDNRKRIAFEGTPVYCPACKTTGVTQCLPPFRPDTFSGVQRNLDGDLCICSCPNPPRLIASSATSMPMRFESHELGGPEQAAWHSYVSKSAAHDEQFLLQDAYSKPLAGVYFSIKLPTGKIVHGTTNSGGLTDRYQTDGTAPLEVYLGHIGVKFPEPLKKTTSNTTPGSILVAKSDRLAKPWKTSKTGIDFIVSFEKLMTKVYLDQAGLPTIGIGHLITPAEKEAKTFVNGLTEDQGVELFSQDLPTYEVRSSDGVRVPLYQHEFDALTSLAYNTWGALGAHSKIVSMLNAGQYSDVPDAVLEYSNIRDKITHELVQSAGLLKRRKAEANIFKTAKYEMHQ